MLVVIWWYDGAVSLGKQLTDYRGWAWSEGFIDLLPQGGGASSGWGCRVSPSREMIHTETGQEPGTHTVGGCQSPAHRTVSPMELYACIVANPAQVLPWCNGVMLLFGGVGGLSCCMRHRGVLLQDSSGTLLCCKG